MQVTTTQSFNSILAGSRKLKKQMRKFQQSFFVYLADEKNSVQSPSDIGKSSIERFLKRRWIDYNELINKVLNYCNVFYLNSLRTKNQLAGHFQQRYRNVLLYENFGNGCFIASTLNTLRIYFYDKLGYIPKELEDRNRAFALLMGISKSDPKYGQFFKNYDNDTTVLIDFPDQGRGSYATNLASSIIFSKLLKHNFSSFLLSVTSILFKESTLINLDSLQKAYKDLVAGKKATLAFINQQIGGHQVSIVGFRKTAGTEIFLKTIAKIIKEGKRWVSLNELNKNLNKLRIEETGVVVIYDQATGYFEEKDLLEILNSSHNVQINIPDSLYSQSRGREPREVESFLRSIHFDSSGKGFVEYNPQTDEIFYD